MYNNNTGWYKLTNPSAFCAPVDSHMKSFNESTQSVKFKSNLELTAFKYCDGNPNVTRWSVEPYPIGYIKPTDNKLHRYFVDLFIEFRSGHKFLVEVKSKSETRPPTPPKNNTLKSKMNYQKALCTWHVNSAKWEACSKFCKDHGMSFTVITERELYA